MVLSKGNACTALTSDLQFMNQEVNTLNKVARITLIFWVLKILATTLGEILGDFFSMSLNLGYTISLLLTLVLFFIVLFIQLKQDRFRRALYWLVIAGTTTAGTEISDLMDRTLGLGYAIGSTVLLSVLLIILLVWYKTERSIKIYPITRKPVELFYWSAILVSNSLGTAFGDFLSDNLGLSYLQGASITAAVILVVVSLHYFTRLNEILLFWIAFIFTRPFGATFGDFLTKPISKGGLNFSRGIAASVTAGLMIAIMLFTTRNGPQEGVSKKMLR